MTKILDNIEFRHVGRTTTPLSPPDMWMETEHRPIEAMKDAEGSMLEFSLRLYVRTYARDLSQLEDVRKSVRALFAHELYGEVRNGLLDLELLLTQALHTCDLAQARELRNHFQRLLDLTNPEKQ